MFTVVFVIDSHVGTVQYKPKTCVYPQNSSALRPGVFAMGDFFLQHEQSRSISMRRVLEATVNS